MENTIVMNTQVSLSRNINNYPFPHKLNQSEAMHIVNKVSRILLTSPDLQQEDFILKNMKDITDIEKTTLIERNIISNKFSKNDISSILINKDKSKFILINGDNHIEIKIYMNNLNLNEAFNIADQIDDILGEKLDYSFNENLGYLASCPVNVGTGLKASVTLHLPILSLQKKIENYHNIGHKLGINIKGICSERSNTLGNMYEITNQNIIGRSEKNTLESLKSMIKEIITKEIESREILKIEANIEVEDEVYRSLGILQNARIISAQEVMKHLSNIKLGIEMDYINDINLDKVINLMNGMKPALRLMSAVTSSSDIERASYIRNEFTLANRNKK